MKLINLLVIGITFSLNLWGQDPVFNQTDNSRNYLNPAYIGTEKSFSADLNYRNQWPELTGNFKTTAFQMNQYLGKGNGVGLHFVTDDAGSIIKKSELGVGCAKQILISEKHHFSVGSQISAFQKSLDWNKLTFGNMIDPRRGFVYDSVEATKGSTAPVVDINFGILYFNKYWFVGYSSKHLTQPNESFLGGYSKLPMRHSVEIGGKIKRNEFTLVPSIRWYNQGTFNTTFAALKIKLKIFEINGGVQFQNGVFGGLGVSTDRFNVSYNYTKSIGNFGINASTHEIRMGCDLDFFHRENEHFFDF